jgi:hypothetical protein
VALQTVIDYVNEARVLLQDTRDDTNSGGTSYRYSDVELVSALNLGLANAHRLRRDLFLKYETTPIYPVLSATDVDIDEGYRRAILFFMVGHAQLRDQEETTDARASAFLQSFTTQMTTAG